MTTLFSWDNARKALVMLSERELNTILLKTLGKELVEWDASVEYDKIGAILEEARGLALLVELFDEAIAVLGGSLPVELPYQHRDLFAAQPKALQATQAYPQPVEIAIATPDLPEIKWL